MPYSSRMRKPEIAKEGETWFENRLVKYHAVKLKVLIRYM